MAIFPALTPTTRIFSPGNYPQTYQQSIGGLGAGFRRGALSIGKTLSLTFEYVLEADVNAIKAHYFESYGTYDFFNLSSTVWSGYVVPPVDLNGNYFWRYVSQPVIRDVTCERFTVEVQLESIPAQNGNLVYAAGLASASPARTYILAAGGASAAPARAYIIVAIVDAL